MHMIKNRKRFFLSMSLAAMLIGAALIFTVCRTGEAEALPSPDCAALIALDGDLALTRAEADIRIAECIRVDVKNYGADGAQADLTMPQIPSGMAGVMLFDGWHLIHAKWDQIGDYTLRVRFRAEDLIKLDGTVGLYLVILAERMEGRI